MCGIESNILHRIVKLSRDVCNISLWPITSDVPDIQMMV